MLSLTNSAIYLRVFKENEIIELWARGKSEKRYSLVRTYDICGNSGDLGPKRAIGDGQVPEVSVDASGGYLIK